MTRYHDASTVASDPLALRLDRRRLRRVHPDGLWSRLRGHRRERTEELDEHMSFEDSRAAVTLSLDPLLVAAYTDELGCSVVLEFGPVAIGPAVLR